MESQVTRLVRNTYRSLLRLVQRVVCTCEHGTILVYMYMYMYVLVYCACARLYVGPRRGRGGAGGDQEGGGMVHVHVRTRTHVRHAYYPLRVRACVFDRARVSRGNVSRRPGDEAK